MLLTTKNILCYTAITAILNLSFQPAYAVKIEELNDAVNHSYARPLMKEDLVTETPQTSTSSTQIWVPNFVKEAGSYSFAALTGVTQLARLASKGIIYAVKNPFQTLTLGLAGQVATVTALKSKQTIRDEIQINQVSYNNVGPFITSLTNENVFVSWTYSSCNFLCENDIYARIFAPNGTALSNEFMMERFQESPVIASLNNGNLFMAWSSISLTQEGNDIYGRIFLSNGAAINNEFPINQNTIGNQLNPSIAILANGNVFVTWDSDPTGNYGWYDIYGRVFSTNGTAINNEFPIHNITADTATFSTAALINGDVFVAWEHVGQALNLYGKIFFANGTAAVNKEFPINNIQTTTFQSASTPSVMSLTNGNVFVAWESFRQHPGTIDFDIYGRIFFSNGTAIKDEFPINQNITSDQSNPSVAGLTDGNIFVTWQGKQSGTYDIYGRIFAANGIATCDEFSINQIAASNQLNPSVAGLTNGNVFVTWQGQQSGNWDIYGRIFATNGAAITNEFPINNITTSYISTIVSSTSGERETNTYSPMSQIASTNLMPSSSASTKVNPTTGNTPESRINSITSLSSPIISSSNPASEPESSRMTSSSTRASTPPSNPPFSPPVQHSSSESSKGMSWKTIAAIGGGVGGAVVASVAGGIIVKKCCFSKKKKFGYARLENLQENDETPTT